MGMTVQHNITAMNSNRMLGVTTSAQAKSTEKLSSGYKINRAADDAAGLSISEKMRKQIRGLTQASANAEDGISAVQTAEGALGEVEDMLQRMNELAVKAANGTNSETDRQSIQDEISQLTTEIDRVAETTKFNETYLLKGDKTKAYTSTYTYATMDANTKAAATIQGTKADGTKATGVVADKNISIKITFDATAKSSDQNAVAKSIVNQGISYERTVGIDSAGTTYYSYSLSLNGDAANNYSVIADKKNVTHGTKIQSGNVTMTYKVVDNAGNTVANIKVTWTKTDVSGSGNSKTASGTLSAISAKGARVEGEAAAYYDKDGNRISENALNKYFTYDSANDAVVAKADAGKVYDAMGNRVDLKASYVTSNQNLVSSLTVKLHVGADATDNNQITMNIESMTAKGLGVNGLKVTGADSTNAKEAIETISEAISKVSAQRSTLGAVQNRLEHTIKNLDNVVENTTSAESAIRDTDMATEMVTFSKNNILSQAGQSMLAQANQSNQGVLSLLG